MTRSEIDAIDVIRCRNADAQEGPYLMGHRRYGSGRRFGLAGPRATVIVVALMVPALSMTLAHANDDGGADWSRQRAQDETGSRSETYHEILDLLFPRDDPDASLPKRFYMVLRFTPSLSRESQLNVTCYPDGRTKVIIYSTPGRPIHWQMNEAIEKTGSWDPTVLASGIQVNKTVIERPSKALARVIQGFAAVRFSPLFHRPLYIDAATYSLWYKSPSAISYYEMQDAYPGHPPYSNPLVGWMNAVLAAASKP